MEKLSSDDNRMIIAVLFVMVLVFSGFYMFIQDSQQGHNAAMGCSSCTSWISPSSHISEGGWSGATKAYDGNINTYATREYWGGYLHLMITQPTTCNKIRVYVSGSAASNVVIYATFADRPYRIIHNGAIPQNQWFEIPVSGKLQGIAISHTTSATLKLHEVEFYIIGEPPPECIEGEYKYEGLNIYQCINGEWVLMGQLEATVDILEPAESETVAAPPTVKFYVESNSPRPKYRIEALVGYYNGDRRVYALVSRYPCPDDPHSVPSGDGYIVTRTLDGISPDKYVEWWVEIYHDKTRIYWNYDNPRHFYTGDVPPPPPPDTVNVYYYLEDYFPSNYDTSNLPRSKDWHGPVGYWYVNRDTNHVIYQHPEKVDGHTYLIDLDADFTYSGSAFYRDKTLQVTEIPYEVVQGSIDMLYETYSNVPPVASFTYSPENPSVGEQIVFDASSSYDTDGSIMEYEWNFGDGSYLYTTLPTATHTYSSTGSFTVTLTVVDNVFGEGSTSKVISPVGPCTLTVDVVGSGHVEISPSLQEFPYGTVVTLTAVPSAGSVFDHWSGDIIGIQNPATIVMECDRTVTAHFSDLPHNEYTITVQATPPDGGYVTCTPSAGSHPSGTVITLSAHAKNGYQFDHWSGDISGTSEMTTVVMDGNKNITAHFEKTVSAGNIFGVIAASLSAIVACAVVVTRWKR